MKTLIKTMLLAGTVALGTTGTGMAQSASTLGSGGSSGGSGTVGSGGSSAAGDTSASTLGVGGTSTGPSGTSSALGTGGSAAGGRATSDSKVHGSADNMHGLAKSKAQDGGTWSKSNTHTKIKNNGLSSRTKSMSHEPGGPPTKSTTTSNVPVQR